VANAQDSRLIVEIARVEREIANRQASVGALRSALESAERHERERRATLRSIDDEHARFRAAVHRRGGVAYVAGRKFDRGMLSLGHEYLRFRGWTGQADIALAEIVTVDTAVSACRRVSGYLSLDTSGRARHGLAARCWCGCTGPGHLS
jgi:hypothetical protein